MIDLRYIQLYILYIYIFIYMSEYLTLGFSGRRYGCLEISY